MAIQPATTIPAAPPAPDRNDRATFADRADAWTLYERDQLVPGVNAATANVNSNATEALNAASSAATAAETATNKASAATAAAATAVNAPGTSGTSSTSLTIGAGTKSFTTQSGKAWVVGQPVTIARTSAGATSYMDGRIASYDSATGAMTVTVLAGATQGSGTFTDWTIGLAGPRGASGVSGYFARSSNTMLAVADAGAVIELTGTFEQTLDTAAALGDGWSVELSNGGTGEITITTDGLTYKIWPGERRRVYVRGGAIRSTVLAPFALTVIASATLTMPPGYRELHALMWDGGQGGSGGGQGDGSDNPGRGGTGGNAGALRRAVLQPAAGSAIAVVVGAGTAGSAANTANYFENSAPPAGGQTSVSAVGVVSAVGDVLTVQYSSGKGGSGGWGDNAYTGNAPQGGNGVASPLGGSGGRGGNGGGFQTTASQQGAAGATPGGGGGGGGGGATQGTRTAGAAGGAGARGEARLKGVI